MACVVFPILTWDSSNPVVWSSEFQCVGNHAISSMFSLLKKSKTTCRTFYHNEKLKEKEKKVSQYLDQTNNNNKKKHYWVKCSILISWWKWSWILCSEHFLCLPESAEPYENKNSESLSHEDFPFFPGFLVSAEQHFWKWIFVLPAGTSGLPWVCSAMACELQVSPFQSQT